MNILRFPAPLYAELRDGLLAQGPLEACGIAFARYADEASAWVVFEAAPVAAADYEACSTVSATLRTAFVMSVANRCRAEDICAVFVHTHPDTTGRPEFSSVDDDGERALASYFSRRGGSGPHAALVIGPDGCQARRLGTPDEVEVREIGPQLLFPSERFTGAPADLRRDRQVRAFGTVGQRHVAGLHVGVVGAGGTGSVVIQQLAHLGVGRLTVVEPDVVDETNLNRLVGAGAIDAGKSKLVVSERLFRTIAPDAAFNGIAGDVVEPDVAIKLAALDFVFVCTDSHASRAVVGQLAYQYLVPTIDMGVSITVAGGRTTHVNGRVQMLAPGLECLVCCESFDPEQVRREMMTPVERAADPYVQGVHEPQPAVISLNSTMASLAVTMFLGAVTPIPSAARFQLYDAVRGHIRPATATKLEDCICCSSLGALARGPSWPLPTRARSATDVAVEDARIEREASS